MPKFIVETISTFHEARVIEADSIEEAKKIAEYSDWNTSFFVGQQVIDAFEYNSHDIARYKRRDKYFFEGTASVDENGYLIYLHPDGTINESMPKEKIF